MLKAIEIENFKCFGQKVSIPLAPITLIYGENSAGKSTILQAVTLLKNALTEWKPVWNQKKDNLQEKAILFSNHYDRSPADIKELTHDGKIDKQISVSFQRDGQNVSIDFKGTASAVSISSQGHTLASLMWGGSAYKWNYGWKLMEELVRRTYAELFKRKADVVEGYKRLIEYETINSYLCSRADRYDPEGINVGASILLQNLPPIPLQPADHLQPLEAQPKSTSATFLEGKRREGLPDWVRTGFPGYTDYVKTPDYKSSYKEKQEHYSKAIAAYSGDLSFDDFCNLHFPSDWKILGESRAACLSIDNAIVAALVPDLAAYCDGKCDHASCGPDRSGILLRLISTKPMWSDSQLPNDYPDLSNWEKRPRDSDIDTLLKSKAKKVVNDMGDMISDIHSLPPVREPPKDSYSEAKANPMFESAIKSRINGWLEKFDVGYTIDFCPGDSLRFLDKRRDSDQAAKITEVGFGFSQLLPIIGYCCRRQPPSVITIEQPELHIHPRLQAELGSLFTDAYKQHGHQIIAESHSEHLMLRLQKLIRKKELQAEDVCVLYVSRDKDGSRVDRLGLDANGDFINDWPGGFFEESYNELFGD